MPRRGFRRFAFFLLSVAESHTATHSTSLVHQPTNRDGLGDRVVLPDRRHGELA